MHITQSVVFVENDSEVRQRTVAKNVSFSVYQDTAGKNKQTSQLNHNTSTRKKLLIKVLIHFLKSVSDEKFLFE